jgi:hypothetical protein
MLPMQGEKCDGSKNLKASVQSECILANKARILKTFRIHDPEKLVTEGNCHFKRTDMEKLW